MNDFVFYKNLNKTEQKRFNTSFNMISSLFSPDYKNVLINKANSKIKQITIGYDKKNIKGHVSSYEDSDITTISIKYEPYNILKKKKSFHISTHEIIHALGKGNVSNDEIYKNNIKKIVYSNVFLAEYHNHEWISYGRIMSEVGVELLTSLSLSLNSKINTKERILADDIIKNDLDFWQSGYKLFAPIARLMTYAMNNDMENSYYSLIKDKKGIIDNKITLIDSENNKYIVPTNDYFYSLMIDGLEVEKVFNYYSNDDNAWKTMCLELDNEYKRAINSKNRYLDQYVINKQVLKIYNMFNNKMFIFKENGIIDEYKENDLKEEFKKILDETLKQFGLIYDKYDEKITLESIDITKSKQNRENIKIKPYSIE